jgi:hypothetical protein
MIYAPLSYVIAEKTLFLALICTNEQEKLFFPMFTFYHVNLFFLKGLSIENEKWFA